MFIGVCKCTSVSAHVCDSVCIHMCEDECVCMNVCARVHVSGHVCVVHISVCVCVSGVTFKLFSRLLFHIILDTIYLIIKLAIKQTQHFK